VSACGDGGTEADPTPEPTATFIHTGTRAFETPLFENTPVPTPEAEATVTASGVEIYELTVGDGEEAQTGSIAYINYVLWVKDGNQIDRNRLEPIRFRLVEGQTLPGLIEGIIGMKVGGQRLVVIPPELAYGSEGAGRAIPPNATIVYQLDLVEVR
jgi:peptidylprolyl isomerase